MEIQRDLIINWCSVKLSLPAELLHNNFMGVLNRRTNDVFNYIFINNINAPMLLQNAIMNNNVDEVLDASLPIISAAQAEYGQVWVEGKRIFMENFVRDYSNTQGGRK